MLASQGGEREGDIRPFDPLRDLEPVVDLIGLAFGDRLDPAGQITLERMRRLAWGGSLLQWLWAFLGKAAVAPGLVWVEEGRIVGNLSLRRARSRGGYLIGNVVVHPDWRRQGIATCLVEAAIDRVSKRGARWIGLEVRADNDAARGLYDGLSFEEVGSTLHVLRPKGLSGDDAYGGTDVMRRAGGDDADSLVQLMRETVSEEHRPLLEMHEDDYRPSWRRWLDQWLKGEREDWWVVAKNERICGAVRALRKPGRYPNQVEILVRSEVDGCFETALVNQGLASLRGSSRKPIEISLPRATDPLLAVLGREGFQKLHTLVQMKRSLEYRISMNISGGNAAEEPHI